MLVAHDNAEVVVGFLWCKKKKKVCGGIGGEGEIGGYGFYCQRGDGLIEGFVL